MAMIKHTNAETKKTRVLIKTWSVKYPDLTALIDVPKANPTNTQANTNINIPTKLSNTVVFVVLLISFINYSCSSLSLFFGGM